MVQYLDMLIGFSLVMLLLSLLIMVLVQAVGVLLQMRGDSLLWGVKQTLNQMGYDATDARAITDRLIRHPTLSANPKIPATAVRFAEFMRLLPIAEDIVCTRIDQAIAQALASGTTFAKDTVRAAVAKALPPMKTRIEHIIDFFWSLPLLKRLRRPTVGSQVEQITDKLVEKLFAKGEAEARRLAETAGDETKSEVVLLIAQCRAEVDRRVDRARAWFNMVMDRSTERFVEQTRNITIGISFIGVFALHIDALQLLKQLQVNPELRAQLVTQAQQMVATGEDMVSRVATQRMLGTEALTAVRQGLDPDGYAATSVLDAVPDGLATRGQGRDWLLGRVPADSTALRDSLLAAYGNEFDTITREWLTELRGQATDLTQQLGATGLEIFSIPDHWLMAYRDWRHLGGAVMAALLLSLGAPFWFNALKNLSNLRPTVARNVEKTEAEEQKRLTGQQQAVQDPAGDS
jgi:hypothetical protein